MEGFISRREEQEQEQEQEQEELRNRGTRCRGALEYWSIVGLLLEHWRLEHWSRGAEAKRSRGAATGRHGRIEASSRGKVWRHGGAIEEWRL